MLSVALYASAGFQSVPAAIPAQQVARGAPLCALRDDGVTSRRAVLRSATLAAAATSAASPAWAGYVTSLGITPTKPQDAEADSDLLASKEVQKGLENLKSYKSAAAGLKAKFESDKNMPLIPVIRAQFDFSKVRDDLNVLTTVFDENTQLTTDRFSRAILYDLTELENAARFKKGEEARTDKKIANVQKWFAKLDGDLDSFLAFFS